MTRLTLLAATAATAAIGLVPSPMAPRGGDQAGCADLRRLDAHRLRNLGIVDRSGIELAVRHGRDPRTTSGD